MTWIAAVIGGGAAIIGGYLSGQGAESQANAATGAAQTSADSAAKALDLQKTMYEQTRADQAPWRGAGTGAVNSLAWGMGLPGSDGPGSGALARNFGAADFQQDPGYQFRLSEGLKALGNQSSARGMSASGASQKGLMRYGQDYASGEYQNAFNRYQSNQQNLYNRLAGIAGTGQTANNAISAAGQNYAGAGGNALMAGGNALAGGMVGAAAANASGYQGIGNALAQGANQYQGYQMMNRLFPQQQSGNQTNWWDSFGNAGTGQDYASGGYI